MVVKLDPHDFYVKPEVGGAEALPALVFWDPDVLAHELETVFRKSWLCVPRRLFTDHNPDVRSIFIRPEHGRPLLDIVKLKGRDIGFRIFGEKIMLSRGSTPKGNPALRAFLDKCPHAGYPFLEGSYTTDGQVRFTCPQHGLTADETGKFISHPAFPHPTKEQEKRLCLSRYQIEEWFDFFFICRDAEPQISFEEVMQPVLASLERMPLQKFSHRKIGKEQRMLEGNWKLHVQNYVDWLHIRYIHAKPNGLADSVDLSSARMELYDQTALMWAYAAKPEDGFDPKYLPERFEHPEKRVFALWWFIFPNLALNFYPWGLSVNLFMPAMVDTAKMEFDPEKLEFLWYHYVWDEEKYKNGLDSQWLNTAADDEDVSAIRYVAESYRAHGHPWSRGLFGSGEGSKTESGPHWFHRTIYEMMFPEEARKENEARQSAYAPSA